MELIPKEAFDLVEKIYGDVASPSLQVIGQTVANILKLVTIPFSCLGITSEELLRKYKWFIQKSLVKVPKEKLVTPEPIIISKVLDDVKFVFDNEDLCDMFSNLLASSMNKDTKDKIHVSFVSIISQMDSVDAKLFFAIHKKYLFPVADVFFGTQNEKTQNVFSRLCVYENIDSMKLSVALVNLIRLGLVEINDNDTLPDDIFTPIKESIIYRRIVCIYEKVKLDDERYKNYSIMINKACCSFTTLGEIFSQYVF